MREPMIRRLAGRNLATMLALALDPFSDESHRGATTTNMRSLKIVVALTTMIAAATAIASLWSQPFLLAFALTSLAFLKHKVFPIRHELFWFVFVGMLGAFAESMIIMAGAWSYASAQIVNIPLWLPAIWGLTGTTIIILYSGVSGES